VNTPIAANSTSARRSRRGQLTGATQEGAKLGDRVSSALAQGMDPDEVGRLVLDAIRTDTFWVFTDTRLLRQVQEQVEQMVGDHTLSRLRLF
jgi:GMP synthase PP-ATPase subunit